MVVETSAHRLGEILRDLGLYRGNRFAVDLANRAIRRRAHLTPDQWPDRHIGNLLTARAVFREDDFRALSVGLDVDPRYLLWTEPPPVSRYADRTFWDLVNRA